MSILIKGMEMPTTCRDCSLSTFTDFDSMPFCNITMDDICLNDWETKRCDNCPLVPIPPHGRLIDADAVRKQMDEKRPGRAYEDAWALTVLDNAPTVDAVSVVRCKDCKHLSVRSGALGVYQCDIHGDYPSGEYYCADGDRKVGDE